MMRALAVAVILVLGFALYDKIPDSESAFYSQDMVFLFVIFLMSLTK